MRGPRTGMTCTHTHIILSLPIHSFIHHSPIARIALHCVHSPNRHSSSHSTDILTPLTRPFTPPIALTYPLFPPTTTSHLPPVRLFSPKWTHYPACLDWEVQEKKDLESRRRSQGVTARSSNAFRGLVPLSKVDLGRRNLPLHDLDALTFAFSQSLKDINIANFAGPDLMLPIHIGRGWPNLPLLTVLNLHTPGHPLALDPLLLVQCRSLTEVRITDRTYEYSYQDIVQCLPAELPGLTTLYLKGWSALIFHPDTLKSTKELTVLKLSLQRSEDCFIPPVAQVNLCGRLNRDERGEGNRISISRPRWTWNWYLPCLKHLALTSEFAYRFEFKMIQDCPGLEYLRSHMRTASTDGEHTRVISEKDLYVDGNISSHSRIVAPSLHKLYMNGRWFIGNPSVLSQFICGIFPNLKRLTARGWQNVSVGSLLEVVMTEAWHIDMVRTDMEGPLLSEEEGQGREMGMILRSNVYMKGPEFMRNRFFCSDKEYVLYWKGYAPSCRR